MSWYIFPFVTSNLAITNLSVSITAPAVQITIIFDSASVAPRGIHGQVACFEWVIVPLPSDVGADGGISSDVGAIGAWRQGPIHAERERCGCRTARVIGVNGVGCIARHILRSSPNATVGRSKGKARW